MEMHTPQSLYATHGLVLQPRPHARPYWIKSLLARFSRMRLALGREWEMRRAVAELKQLDDHLLDDLGLRRSDIEHVVRGGRAKLRRPSEDTPC